MKSIISSLLLLLTAVMLSGCIFPYWDHHGHGHRGHHDGYRGDGHRGGDGYRGGGGRR